MSTTEQSVQLQVDALTADGCTAVYADEGVSGAKTSRPELDKCRAALKAGDTLVVWKLDRLGRSLAHLVTTVDELRQRQVGFRSLTESIDTTTNGGRMIFGIFAVLADFERGLIRERTMAGLATAKANGRTGGRKHRLSPEQRAYARQMHADGKPVVVIARVLGVARPIIYRAIEGK